MLRSLRRPPVVPRSFKAWAAVWFLVTLGISLLLAGADRSSDWAQAAGNLGILAALLFSSVACAWAARRRREARLGWGLMAVSWLTAALGQVVYSLNALAGEDAPASPVLDTIAYLGYSVPVLAALLAFPRPPARLVSRFRQGLDAVVIAAGLSFLSEATVLRPVRQASELQGLAAWSGLAYPVADLAICAVVLTLGMRQPPEQRRIWLWLGTGLVVLAVTDSVYVRLLADGQTDLTATPLVIGWMAAPVLTALASLLPARAPAHHARDLTLAEQLIPYAPALGALLVLPAAPLRSDPFLQVVGVLLLVTVTVRQALIIYENVSLTRDLEAKVAARTSELTTLGSIVTSSGDAVVGISAGRIVTAWNPAAEALYGHRAADVLDRPVSFLPEDGLARVDELLARAERGENLEGYEIDWVRPDGSVVAVALRVSPVQTGDTVTGISVFGQDITERRRAAAALDRAREEALEASRLKSEFLATMSHEIRTPMNGVIGLTTLLLDTDLDEGQRHYASGVLGAAEALLAVINDILDFSKLEAGKVTLDPVAFDVRRMVEDVGVLLAPSASAKGLEFLTYTVPDVPHSVYGDPVRIRQVVINLTSNAIKFTARGEVVVRVEAVDRAADCVRLRFEVTDTGIGITEEDLSRLFQSFSQADASTTRRYGGSGLGLAISRGLAEVMGGTVGVRSVYGEGSTFWFEITLPVAEPPDGEQDDPDGLRGLRVLIVDDNATNREIVGSQLASWGMHADAVPDARTGLARLRTWAAEGRPYDLLVLDMLMPEVDGLELARMVSADPVLRRTGMILLTSSLALDPELLRAAGIRQWLSKPVRSCELYGKLVRLRAPRSNGHTPAEEPKRTSSTERRPPGLRGRVLVVEDNDVNRLVAEGMLARLGYTVDTAVDGRQAVVAAASGCYAAILMDCHMPEMDGFTATREIRDRQGGSAPRVPIIAMTAGALAEDRDRCLAAGMDDYVSKPVSSEVLDRVLSSWVAGTAGSVPGGAQAQATGVPADHPVDPCLDEDHLSELRELGPAGDAGLLTSIVESFLAQAERRLAALRGGLADGDLHRVHEAAHELGGAAGTVGARRVATRCRTIERAARRGELSEQPQLVEELAVELEQATSALGRLVVSVP